MSRRPLPSLDAVLSEVRAEREAQLKHFDSLDSKAGILLGFAGALIALSPQDASLMVDTGRAFAVLAAGAALWAFWPRKYQITNLRVLRDRYLAADQLFTLQRILDTSISMTGETFVALRAKAWRLKAAMSFLAVAAALLASGLALN
ncbi:MAG: hypothetical protein ACRDH8_08200 [Actinomycetota bacterium]